MTKQRNTAGFTLIELMITVAIVGILLAIALPSYKNYIIRSKLVTATNALSTMHAQMEQYYLDNRTYMAVTGSTPAITPPCVQYAITASASLPFTVDCATGGDVPTATTYRLRATGTAAVEGAVYTVDQANSMVTVRFPTSWGAVPASNGCWLMRKGDSC
ncbi:MAG: type IV pilin protein [Vitreoscilla sp.]